MFGEELANTMENILAAGKNTVNHDAGVFDFIDLSFLSGTFS